MSFFTVFKTKLYAAGGIMKKMGKGIADWADAKNLEIAEEKKEKERGEKTEKVSQNGSDDIYDALFGDDELNKTLGF